jgi:hypothetical protein
MAKVLSEVLTGKKSVPQPVDATIMQVAVTLVLPAAAPVANDLLELLDLPPGVDLVDFDILSPQIDSNGAPTAAFSLGHENAGGTDLGLVYEAGLTFGRTANGSVSRATTAAQLAAVNTAPRRLALKVTTGFATYAGAGKTVTAILHLRG